MSKDNEIVASTEFHTENCTFTWIIKDYSLIIKDVPGESLTSPEFSLSNDPERKFYLKLYPGGECEKSSQFISLFLHTIKNGKKPEFVCKCTLSTLTKVGGSSIYWLTFHRKFEAKTTVRGWAEFYEKENYQKLLAKNGSMIICCKLSVSSGHKTSIISNGNFTEQDMIGKLLDVDFLFLNEELSDFKLKTSDGKDIPIHKAILAAASPVFRAMFTHDMLENKNNSVEIMDTPRNIVIELLRYIYKGEIETTDTDIILKLLQAAEKYQISNLKIKCGKILSANLSTENVIQILIAAHKYQIKYLENEVMKFVAAHIRSLIDFEKLQQIADPAVLLNIIQSITKTQENIS